MLGPWFWASLLTMTAPLAHFDEGFPANTPSLSPYTRWDLAHTFAFADKPGRPWVQLPWRSLRLSPYTDAPKLWTPLHIKQTVRLTRWYLARCRIRLVLAPLRSLPAGSLKRPDGQVRLRLARPLLRSRDPYETLIFFTRQVHYAFDPRRPPYRLLGLSALIQTRDRRGAWHKRRAVWTRLSPVYTTLVHEIGHRLGLRHKVRPYDLMLTGYGVRSSFWHLWTSALGFFDPQRFRFFPSQCRTMHRFLPPPYKK